jgi:GcrA cell cycle regulator
MEWTEEAIGRLRVLWSEGHSTAEIGRRLGVSKNAVVGKAHRLDLPARPSPIRRDGNGGAPRRPAPPRIAGPTLPPLSSTALPANDLAAESGPPARLAPATRPAMAPPVHRPVMPPPPRPAPTPRPFARAIACCWPIGEPGTPTFHFCDADAVPGKPYCEPHAQIAYVKVRDRREDAA